MAADSQDSFDSRQGDTVVKGGNGVKENQRHTKYATTDDVPNVTEDTG